jgi:hypothetical protein
VASGVAERVGVGVLVRRALLGLQQHLSVLRGLQLQQRGGVVRSMEEGENQILKILAAMIDA